MKYYKIKYRKVTDIGVYIELFLVMFVFCNVFKALSSPTFFVYLFIMACNAQLPSGQLSGGNFLGDVRSGKCPQKTSEEEKCPDAHAGLQVSVHSGYDLCHPG